MVLFPVSYSEKFYKDVLEAGEFAKLAYFNDVCVGAVCCRKEPIPSTSPKQAKLYIMTLGVLAPYRNLGLGTALLKHILHHATSGVPATPKFTEIYLHVQISNEEALKFYKKYDFEIVGTVEGYYKKISPSDAYTQFQSIVKESSTTQLLHHCRLFRLSPSTLHGSLILSFSYLTVGLIRRGGEFAGAASRSLILLLQ